MIFYHARMSGGVGDAKPQLDVEWWHVERETPCGYWIARFGTRRWISKRCRKYTPTYAEAIASVRRRAELAVVFASERLACFIRRRNALASIVRESTCPTG